MFVFCQAVERMDALSIDAANTLLHPAEPVAQTYARFARAHGVDPGELIGPRLMAAMRRARPLRQTGPSWRPFWREVVHEATGCDAPALIDQLIEHFARARAWRGAEGAQACCEALRERGIEVALISNWDEHLRPLLGELGVSEWIDVAVISAEEGIEKPDPRMFLRACERLGVSPAALLHVGDRLDEDVEGARAAGCQALHFGVDVADFFELARRLTGRRGAR